MCKFEKLLCISLVIGNPTNMDRGPLLATVTALHLAYLFTCCWLLPALVAFSIISGYPGAPRGKGRAAQCPCKCWWPQKDEVITLKCDPLWYYEAWKAPPRMKATSRNQINAGLHHMSWLICYGWLPNMAIQFIRPTHFRMEVLDPEMGMNLVLHSFMIHPGLNFYHDSKSG